MRLRTFKDVVSMLRLPQRQKPDPWMEYLPRYLGDSDERDCALRERLSLPVP
jgi:hypothetical protein